MSDPIKFFIYFIALCISVHYQADGDSFVEIYIPNSLRYLLCIFTFNKSRISVIVVAAQLYLYFVLMVYILFLLAKLPRVITDADTFFSALLFIHVIIVSIGGTEMIICGWWNKRMH